MDPLLTVMLTDTITHAAYVSQDSYGQPTYAAGVSHAARIDYRVRRFMTAQGQERVSQAVVYLAWDFALDLRDKLTLDDGTSPALQRVDRFKDEVGNPHHYEAYL
jgi:hypothetical protein